jgi:hypothetical protein
MRGRVKGSRGGVKDNAVARAQLKGGPVDAHEGRDSKFAGYDGGVAQ